MGRDFPGDTPIDVHVGPVKVTVTMETVAVVIERYHPEAVVSSDDTNLSHSGGVSAAIARLAGPGYSRALAELPPLEVGDIAVTFAGDLPLRYVLHAATVDWENDIHPTERTIRGIARQLFTRCEALAIRSIAVPAIGTGAASFRADVSGALVADALVGHVRGATLLERVIFTVPDEETHALFASYLFEHLARDPRTARPFVTGAGRGPSPEFEGKRDDRERPREIAAVRPRMRQPGSEEHLARGLRLGPARWWQSLRRRRREPELPTAPTLSAPPEAARTPPTKGTPPLREEREFATPDTRPLLDGRYVLLEELGRGGFAIVYLAWDLVLRRTIAIKRLRSDVSAADTLWREAAVALDLAHEGIVRVLHYEPRKTSGGPFLVQEYVTWPTGEAWIADAGSTPLPVGVVLGVGLKLCDALAFAHGRGVLHLDIKPGNVFVDPAGERAKLADFGLARILERGAPKAVQLHGAGTPQYMAPEQWQAGAKIAATTDIYQLAATLWDFLTGEPPDREARRTGMTDRLRSTVLGAVSTGLNPDPSARPSTAKDFAARLAAAA